MPELYHIINVSLRNGHNIIHDDHDFAHSLSYDTFKGGVVTAGSASGICDGAAAVVVASEDAVKKHNLTPLAR